MSSNKMLARKLRGWMLSNIPGMITCRQFDGFLVDYLDGALPPGPRRRFELHLAVCRECRRYLAGYRRTIALTRASLALTRANPGGADQTPLPDEVPESLVEAVLTARRAEPTEGWRGGG